MAGNNSGSTLRQRALFIDDAFSVNDFGECAADFCAEMLKLGYVPDEKLLRALNGVNAEQLAEIYSVVKENSSLDCSIRSDGDQMEVLLHRRKSL